MQQFKSRGKIYNLPDNATHAAPGACSGLYFKDDRGQWFFTGGISDRKPIKCGLFRGFYDEDIIALKPKRNPFAFWNQIKGAIFK